ncbi:PP2C family protein-serine/threonine phosphatase [Kineococcus sp. SYSU DK005]|uniref:PP2C family protein-serine/threonine phosphatase n=1 Tax=Kineococcus sp. SYSU DK005 TaxID=3383126 RepID=UPI003D7CA622
MSEQRHLTGEVAVAAARLFDGVLRRTHLSAPHDVAGVVAGELREALGAGEVQLWLAGYEQAGLVPVPGPGTVRREVQPVDGSMAGRAFSTAGVVGAAAEPGPDGGARRRLWVPLLDGTDRLGVLELTLPVAAEGARVEQDVLSVLERCAHLVAMVVASKDMYGDVFARLQRAEPLTVGSEMVRAVLPPQTYATDDLVVSGALEPAYDNGGDAFDYADDEECLHLAVFDGMGHGLAASAVTTLAVAAYRRARRTGLDLPATYAEVDAAVAGQFGGDRHVTAVLARLDRATGALSWVSAGHPPPLLLRGTRVVKTLRARPSFPLGWSFGGDVSVAEEVLQSGDAVLLYTDGLVEARREDGELLGVEGLSDFLEQQAAAGQPAAETLRRLRRTILSRPGVSLRDDATALLVEWRRGGEHALVPQTVEG